MESVPKTVSLNTAAATGRHRFNAWEALKFELLYFCGASAEHSFLLNRALRRKEADFTPP